MRRYSSRSGAGGCYPGAPASWVAPRHRGSRMPRFASGIEFDYAFRSPALPAQELALLLVLGPVDLTASKAPIENIDRCGASFADGRPIRYPDNNCSQSHENE